VAALAAAVAVGLVAGCTALPTSGPVRPGRDGAPVEAPVLQAIAAPPVKGVGPEEIAQGFLQAALAGSSDGYQVARQYLTPAAAETWEPSSRVALYRASDGLSLQPVNGQEGRLALQYSLVAEVGGQGQYRDLGAGKATTVNLDLEQVAGEWRLATPPDGVVVPQTVFTSDWVQASVYWPTLEGRMLVPDVRYFPRRTAPTAAVAAFMAGPPDYLAGAVVSPVPPGTALATDAVRLAGGRATVNLDTQIRGASETERAVLQACLTASLTGLPGVTTVELQAESVPLEVPARPEELQTNPAVPEGVYYLGEGGLWRFATPEPNLVAGFAGAVAWTTLTLDHEAKRAAGMADGELAYIAGVGEEAQILGAATAPPQFDTVGRLWSANADQLTTYGSEGEAAPVAAEWLDQRTVVALAPSRDGARLAVVSRLGATGRLRLDVAGVVRDSGVPTTVGAALTVADFAGGTGLVAWVDQTTLAVVAPTAETGDPMPHLVTVGGPMRLLNAPLDRPNSLTAGRGSDNIYVTGEVGGLFRFNPAGTVWSPMTVGAKAVTVRP
jgi:hypothetical protein